MLNDYLKYRKARVNAHGIHSPFVFEFYNEIVKKHQTEIDSKIEALRTNLVRSKKKISFNELGAGSRKGTENDRTVKSIAKHAATAPKFGGLLARICHFYEIESVLEFGTSLGIGTSYLAKHAKSITTLEGCESVLELANENFKTLGYHNVNSKLGEFSTLLNQFEKDTVFDLIYIDGNHRLEPTLDYFEFALNHSHNNTFIILDDIYWSEEMKLAWEKIKADERINVSLDLFRLGIVCKRTGQRKQDFVLKI